ncbi:DUF777 family protein (plasmid) [Borrelia miyamotoi]|uniref:DUF777 family protein n=3 Tax=Borrelia miyamotoi TaxID=47466 RepID=A0AAQ3CNT7_9SPIR|nr:DUF777 family protein [Borrelia miyamotoi]AHH05688.1 Hypothetical protein BOM_1145 [Borrelia miyamotoi FR64b]ATQ20254.2 DUF777 family protein [Borrelia miyamotoi]QBK62610.1 DUF777 family protein [Borrelia miyamotoi]QDA32775.1 DUF777 family protein [Borrelia miyamotoi]WAZ71192.1 DUF777 family protein [Borrelia miyamotoi]
MTLNYDLYRMNQNFYGSTLTQEEIKLWIYSNIFITKIGTIKTFDTTSQKGIVIIKEFDNLEIETHNISNININPNEGELVLLLQSSINLFNENDNINFDKNHFYILSIINPKYLEMACDEIALKTTHKLKLKSNNQIDIHSDNNIDLIAKNKVLIKSNNKIDIRNDSQSLKNILIDITDAIANLRVTGQAIIDESSRAGIYGIRSRIYDLLS